MYTDIVTKVISSAIGGFIISLLAKVIYESLGTIMTRNSSQIGSSHIYGANIRTIYAGLGVIITQIQIMAKDYNSIVPFMVGYWIGTWLGTLIGYALRDIEYTEPQVWYKITCKSINIRNKITNQIKETNKNLKQDKTKTISWDWFEGLRFDKSYYYIEGVCKSTTQAIALKKILNNYHAEDAIAAFRKLDEVIIN